MGRTHRRPPSRRRRHHRPSPPPGHHAMNSHPPHSDPDELALIAAGFPEFSVWRSVTVYRTRYIAQSRRLGVHPHTVVTDDLAELAAALTAGRSPASSD